ncbi:MAG: hypothetical protein MJA27_29605 [Pseudanabaenales cyanobacterium]|nr:hypothetical protein [Pseudanabaenales cyanobacterium]
MLHATSLWGFSRWPLSRSFCEDLQLSDERSPNWTVQTPQEETRSQPTVEQLQYPVQAPKL